MPTIGMPTGNPDLKLNPISIPTDQYTSLFSGKKTPDMSNEDDLTIKIWLWSFQQICHIA